MNLSDLCTDQPTSQALVKAGVVIDTVFYHIDGRIEDRRFYDNSPKSIQKACTPAFTAQELAEWYAAQSLKPYKYSKYSEVWDMFIYQGPVAHVRPDKWAELILELIEKEILQIPKSIEQ